MIHRPKRVTDQGPVDDLDTNDLLAIYCIEYETQEGENAMETFGVAMVSLLTALPEERLWSKPSIYTKDNSGVIHIEGVKKKLYEVTNA